MADKKELQKKYIHLYLLKEQLKGLAEERSAVESRISELLVSADAVEKLGSVKQGEEVWSPLGSGIFIRSDIKDAENVLVGIGAGVVVKRPARDAAEILRSRLEELVKIHVQMAEETEKFRQQIEGIEKQLEELSGAK